MAIEALPSAVFSEVRNVSVVVPVWRESADRLAALGPIVEWPEVREVIVAAAEETETVRVAVTRAGALCLGAGRPNRGRQLNLGARHATGEWLLFNHADTQLTRAHAQALATLTPRADIVGGAFHRHFDERHPRWRWLEPLERWHNRSFGALYGDQSIFVRRAHFADRLGGFADIALMEDVEFSQRLRRSGRVALLDPAITSSSRRHLQCGCWKTTLTNAMLIVLFRLGVQPERLHAWYYGIRQPAAAPASILTQTHES
ncbi:MAG TPA: TIGR04283 family arsenosugar biosynthesis glycosyltransferase [Chthoniobacteraceae bacterium]|jgi:rSAM/selenodomain-associated transferase 2|nr:TIGR04283 family arsenosugar biosynthesis glycosyltransferase [Chthoniobacteraceae bacterium]